ncbi:hypothetical protein M747DRAFT_328256 [Aspergillus niger ATCC 13496]|uniref:Uncharacterized protein n=1 Tax=Aspergillus niger ATCC 13496 TaxID=1353008 RepID=A0A370CDX5_ASPNG|nr:hypothetical protein M747DRAFT_328256 [Aspergillus niger ATCC 13496]
MYLTIDFRHPPLRSWGYERYVDVLGYQRHSNDFTVAYFGVEASATPSRQPSIPIKADCRDKDPDASEWDTRLPTDPQKPRIASHGNYRVNRVYGAVRKRESHSIIPHIA